jgi:hypothetical protein
MDINIKITLDEVNSILELLGKLPNSSNTYSLFLKIRDQGVEQIKKNPHPVIDTAE